MNIWLITGASSGFGRAIAADAIAAGDTVIGTARRTSALDDLVAAHPDRVEAIRLDMTDSKRIDEVAADVLARYGRVDVLVNSAGRTQVGAFEETTEDELRDLFEVHVFGPARLTRALLPGMRERGSGSIVNISSFGGQLSFAGFSAYSATKAALEQLSEALADEITPYGVKVLIVEPGSFRTNLFGKDAAYFSTENPAYAEKVGATRAMVRGSHGIQPGDPAKAAQAIRMALNAANPPLRLALGGDAVDFLAGHLDSVRAELAEWEKVSRGTDFDGS
ncbi:SDR family NAD(P)-dependent oxidoreductase [Actinoplanes sp. TBRC 11911]|uniref:oxidoreductase n=1 Tax=Actinoplanes sp. TBRC 11911 TaxID=2729386 RepID=UPI00145C7DF0|nr:oxidoreductase [Actinoplanes sp. TBRC 11911]NMO51306.1 SDR family NAD(P)-dependent oxidoreductase [Actinoplanes sp. TBRC 11911]